MFRSRVASKNNLCSPEPRRADVAEPLFAVSRWGISAVVPAKPICSLWVVWPTNCTNSTCCMHEAQTACSLWVIRPTNCIWVLHERPLKCPSMNPQTMVWEVSCGAREAPGDTMIGSWRQHRLYAAPGCISYFSMPLSSETQKLHDFSISLLFFDGICHQVL